MPTGQDIVTAARSYLGVPFVHQGRNPHAGLDCAGLVLQAAWDNGLLKDFDYRGYAPTNDGSLVMRMCREQLTRVPLPQREPGDVLALRSQGQPRHLGIYDRTGSKEVFVHAFAPAHKVVVNALTDSWLARLVAVFRFPGLEEAG